MPCTPLFLFPPYQKPPSNGLRQRRNPKKTAHRHRFAPTARCGKNRRRAVASPIIIGLRQRRNAKKTAEERFNMLARGWLAYPVTPTHHQSTAEERLYNRHPSVCLPRDALRHTQRAEPPFPGSPALRLNQLLFSYSITFCALPSTTTTYTPLSRRTSPMPRNANCPATV